MLVIASEAQVTALLLGLKMKGETVEERTAIAKVMQAYAVAIPTEVQGAMDNCGTGAIVRIVSIFQQQLPSSLLVVASRWRNTEIVRSLLNLVLRMLEALGLTLIWVQKTWDECLKRRELSSYLPKNLHPGMRYIMPARLALGVPTVMNLTGPLINPIPLETQLLGTSRPDMLESTAEILKNLGRKRAVVVSGPQGLDEAGLDGETQLAILENGQVTLSSFQPEDIGMERIEIDQVRGGDAKRNAEILLSVLKNEASPFLEVTVLNAGLGFMPTAR